MSEAKVDKGRKYPTITFSIAGWPEQDPGRKMVYKVCWKGEVDAQRQFKRISRLLKGDAVFELEHMTSYHARRMKNRGFLITDHKKREALRRMEAAAG